MVPLAGDGEVHHYDSNIEFLPRENSEIIDNDYDSHIINTGNENVYALTPHETFGKSGNGVKIGVLEVTEQSTGGTIYDANSSFINGLNITSYSSENPSIVIYDTSSHATNVITVLAGIPTTLNGTTYQGIAPNADIYYANLSWFDATLYPFASIDSIEFESSLTWFKDKNVDIINMSFGFPSNTYSNFDAMLDYYINMYNFIVVVSAGNYDSSLPTPETRVTSPSLSYNCITVGNLSFTKTYNKYDIADSSSFGDNSNSPNKPDLCMFGTKIYNGSDSFSGTSFSAPFVSGTIACMLEAKNSLRDKPDTIKSILTATAMENLVSSNNSNDLVGSTNTSFYGGIASYRSLRDKSGAGLLSIIGAINTATNSSQVYRFCYKYYNNTIQPSWSTQYFYLEEGQSIEASLVFNTYLSKKDDTNAYNVNYNLEVLDENSNTIASINSTDQNVEAAKFTSTSDGYYKFKLSIVVDNSNFNNMYSSNMQNAIDLSRVNMYATLTLTCGCEGAKLLLSNVNGHAHDVYCSCCGFHCIETNDFCNLSSVFHGFHITHYLFYKFNYSNLVSYNECSLEFSYMYNEAQENSIGTSVIDFELDSEQTIYDNDLVRVKQVYYWIIVSDPYNIDIYTKHQGFYVIQDLTTNSFTLEFIN
jgi:hypothetical protein